VFFEMKRLRKHGGTFRALVRLDFVVDYPHVFFEIRGSRKLGRAFLALVLDAVVYSSHVVSETAGLRKFGRAFHAFVRLEAFMDGICMFFELRGCHERRRAFEAVMFSVSDATASRAHGRIWHWGFARTWVVELLRS